MDTHRKFRILIAEDEFLIALMLSDALEDLGCEVIGPASRLADAQHLVSTVAIDGALLDINLRGEAIFPVVDILRARDVPVVLCTGYDSAGAIPPHYAALPIIGKPFDADTVKAVVSRQVIGRGGGTVTAEPAVEDRPAT